MKEILDLMFLEIFRVHYQTTEHIMLLCYNIYHNSSGYSFEYGTTCTINPYLGLRMEEINSKSAYLRNVSNNFWSVFDV